MPLIVFAIILIWFAVGAVIALWIFSDSRSKFDEVALDWVIAGFFLSIIGAFLYKYASRQRLIREAKYPPEPRYDAPKYEFEEKKAIQPVVSSKDEEKKKDEVKHVQQIEGIPRCPHCGAAISTHDWNCPACGKKLRY
ncbi:MAG: hypothetical protein QHH00_07090 [Methanomassiliicoccales archaeon]|jgi:rubrerythrin|nr:hypothetical protein [Methanomassiliicoccales archaeon]